MPREIVTTDGNSFHFRDYALPPLGERDVRAKTLFAAPKHGTESHSITGSSFEAKEWDPELRLFLPRNGPRQERQPVERRLGNMVVGTVTEIGGDVACVAKGDTVFGYGPIRELQQ